MYSIDSVDVIQSSTVKSHMEIYSSRKTLPSLEWPKMKMDMLATCTVQPHVCETDRVTSIFQEFNDAKRINQLPG